jgi:uncharacterized membrane protein YgdD (TMEM256/DUF423 family)
VGGIGLGSVCCALAVVAGAFGAHLLEGTLDAHALTLWETGARYLMYSGLGQVLAGLAASFSPDGGFRTAAGLLLGGGAVFSGTVFALALGAPRWFGAVTPVGGVLLILGFAAMAWSGFKIYNP